MLQNLVLAALLALAATSSAVAQTDCADFSAELATTPVPPQSTFAIAGSNKLLKSVPRESDIVLLGDSILQKWSETLAKDAPGQKIWNFSVVSDRTQNLLWRLNQLAEGAAGKPKGVVLLIGTNNIADYGMDACGIEAGIRAVTIKAKSIWPETPVFVLTILPRGADFKGFDKERAEINAAIQAMDNIDDKVFSVRIDDGEITCGQNAKDILPPNTTACFPLNKYVCKYYNPDNLHLTVEAFPILMQKISAVSIEKLGFDIFG